MRILLLFIFGLFYSCSSKQVVIPSNSRSAEYNNALQEYSSIVKSYNQFEDQIDAIATAYTSSFREALKKEVESLYGTNIPEGARELYRTENCLVFLSIRTPDYDNANISEKENALKVVVTQHEKETTYDSMKKITSSHVFKEFFPYFTNWHIGYFLEFANVNCNEPFQVNVQSPKTKLAISFPK